MAVTGFLADTSAIARISQPTVTARLRPLVDRGLVHTCAVLDLEAGRSAKSTEDYEALMRDRALLYTSVMMPSDGYLSRVMQIQHALVVSGIHRGVGIADMLIAATAQMNDLTVLHYDHDFDLIADVTSVSTEWVVPQGSVD